MGYTCTCTILVILAVIFLSALVIPLHDNDFIAQCNKTISLIEL